MSIMTFFVLVYICAIFISLSYAGVIHDGASNDIKIISRAEWGARPPASSRPLREKPPPFVVIHHTATPACLMFDACTKSLRSIQTYHMDHNKWEDIGYNFLIGGNGDIFEGRGWGVHGAHSPIFNARSIGIALIGNFVNVLPPLSQLKAAMSLVEHAVGQGYITEDYRLIGHRQGSATECPGLKLFNEIQSWPQYDPTKYFPKKTKD